MEPPVSAEALAKVFAKKTTTLFCRVNTRVNWAAPS